MGEKTEVWLRGEKTPGLLAILQPTVDALLEAQEEIEKFTAAFPDELLWTMPANCASVGFHLKHIPGVQDRVLTYAEGKSLSEKQFAYIKHEREQDSETVPELVSKVKQGISLSIERLKKFPELSLTEARKVGRTGLPSTVIGLCVHAAEHTMRHTGQLLVTIRVVLSQNA